MKNVHESERKPTVRDSESNEARSAERSVHKSEVPGELRPFLLVYGGGRCGGVEELKEPVYCSRDAGSSTAKTQRIQHLPTQGVHVVDVPSL